MQVEMGRCFCYNRSDQRIAGHLIPARAAGREKTMETPVKLVVADDEPIIRMDLCQMLEELGH